jgi:hypothetical protein
MFAAICAKCPFGICLVRLRDDIASATISAALEDFE